MDEKVEGRPMHRNLPSASGKPFEHEIMDTGNGGG